MVIILRTRRVFWSSQPVTLLLAAMVAVGMLAVMIPWLWPVAELFGFSAKLTPVLASSHAIVAVYAIATEGVKLCVRSAVRL